MSASSIITALSTAPDRSRRLRLYELPERFRILDEMLEDLAGELTPEIEEELSLLEGTLEDKTDAICGLVKDADAEADYFRAELERLATRKRVAENRAKRLKEYLQTHLVALGRDKVKTDRFSVRIQKNSAPSIKWAGAGEIPMAFARIEVSPDGDLIKAAHKAGTLPEGFEVNHGSHLRIS